VIVAVFQRDWFGDALGIGSRHPSGFTLPEPRQTWTEQRETEEAYR